MTQHCNSITYGRSACAMEIDAMGPRCYNCGQFGRIANKCMKPKQEKGTCFECRKKDHMIKDCPICKKKLATKKQDRSIRLAVPHAKKI